MSKEGVYRDVGLFRLLACHKASRSHVTSLVLSWPPGVRDQHKIGFGKFMKFSPWVKEARKVLEAFSVFI